jgi:recombination protein RecR
VNALPLPLQRLEQELGKLPGIGPRSAARIALYLVRADPAESRRLTESITAARERIAECQVCGGLTETQPCPLCTDPRRDAGQLCVVEQPVDILALERSGVFQGRYHALGGVLSPLNGIGPEDLRIEALDRRLDLEPIREVVIALATSVEGDATGHYLAQRLAGRSVRVTRLAYGLPAGSGIEFADEVTLRRAIEGRRELTS